jgi:hypothetical protein
MEAICKKQKFRNMRLQEKETPEKKPDYYLEE